MKIIKPSAAWCTKYLQQITFWFHVSIVLFLLPIGLFLSLPKLIILLLAHKLHLFVFKDCLISKFQKRIGGLPKNTTFVQFATKKLFKTKLSNNLLQKLYYSFVATNLTIALVL